MANRKATVKGKNPSDMAAYNVSVGNFWDVGNYNRCPKRITDSNNLLDDLVKMFTERAEIEAKYSRKLTDWHDRWSKHLESSPATYATMKTAQLGTLKEANDRAVIHMDCWGKIHNQVVETVKREKESKYHKAFVGIKEAKELDDEFTKAQKPWATAFGKVQRAKKNYHSSCKQMDSAQQTLNQANKDGEIPIEKIKKLEEVLRKNETSVAAMKKKYEEKLARIDPVNIAYEDEMRKVYSKFEKEEEGRKDFIQRMLVEFHKAVNICEDYRLKECFDNQINVAYSGKSSYDVKWWSENFGADMARNWPKFEVYSSSEWSAWSNRNSLSSIHKKQSRRYVTRPRARPYDLKPRDYVPKMKMARRFTLTRKRMSVPSDTYSVDTMNMDYLDRELAKFSKEDIKTTLATTLGVPFGLSLRDSEVDSYCPEFLSQKSRQRLSHLNEPETFSLPSIRDPKDSTDDPFIPRARSRSLGDSYTNPKSENMYTSFHFSNLFLKELGDLPDLPPPISAVEPPDMQRYNSTSIPRSTSNQYMQPPQQQQPPQTHSLQEEPVASYQPTEDPDSNPFMNGGDSQDGMDDDDWDEPPPIAGGGIPVRAMYDYNKIEDDELSFKANDILTKLTEEDEQGWCRGRINDIEGLYPANYVEPI